MEVDTPSAGGGRECPELSESEECGTSPCSVDCRVSQWSSWSTCSASCGGGRRSRERTVATSPALGGRECPELTDTEECGMSRCPCDGFRCDNDNCISRRFKCDEDNDCGDWSDEKDCTCRGFRCDNGNCASRSYRCHDWNDCPDWSDCSSNWCTESVSGNPLLCIACTPFWVFCDEE